MSESTSKIEPNKEASLAEQVWNTLEESKGRENVNEIRKQQQLAILKNLPKDFEMEMKAFVFTESNPTNSKIGTHIKGELFEHLVRADSNICPSEETPIAFKFRSLIAHPKRFEFGNTDIFNSIQIPDVAFIDEKGQITGAVEVKSSGKIDQRGTKQLFSFKEKLSLAVDTLRNMGKDTLKTHGLEDIANNLDHLGIAPNFAVTLAIPSEIYNGDATSLIDIDRFESQMGVQVAKLSLNNCIIKESPFSHKDLEEITKCILNRFKKDEPTQER